MAPTPPFYQALNEFCERFGVEIAAKHEAENGQTWEIFIPNWGFLRETAADKCDPTTGYHSSPHKGCLLR